MGWASQAATLTTILQPTGGVMPARKVDALVERTVYVSSIPNVTIGCNIATGLDSGGNSINRSVGVANATAINAILAVATATRPVHLHFDCGIATGAAIVLPPTGNVAITGNGWHTGIAVLAGSNCNAIQNFPDTNLATYQAWNPSGSQAGHGSRVTLDNFYVNANRGTYPNGNSNGTIDNTINGGNAPGATFGPTAKGPYSAGYWLSGIIFVGLDKVKIDRVFVQDAPTYHIHLLHCTNVSGKGVYLWAGDNTVQNNTDAFHFTGGSGNVNFTECDLRVGDDAFAINMAEGDALSGGDFKLTNSYVDSLTIARVYGKNTTILGDVVISDISGNVAWFGFIFGEVSSVDTGADSSRSTTLDKIRVTILGRSGSPAGPCLVLLNGNAGPIYMDGCKLGNPTGAYPMVRTDTNSPIISLIQMDRCGIYRSAAGNAAAYILEASNSGAIIKNLVINDFSIEEQAPNTYADIANLIHCDGATVLNVKVSGRFFGVGNVINVTANSTVSNIAIDDCHHKSNQGSGHTVTVATTGHSTKIPVSLGRYTPSNITGFASGDVTLGGPGVISSGSSYPDAMIPDNTIYNSSDQSVICWKHDGIGITLGTIPAATAFSVTGPTAGTTNAASTAFTVQPNGVYTGTITMTPSGGGLSTPIVKTFSASSAPQTFTITPTSNGTVTLTFTNNGSLSNQSPISYVASAGTGTLIDDTFTGTAGTNLVGQQATPTNNGSDLWTIDSAGPSFIYASGGHGVIAPTGGSAFASYPLTSALANQTITVKFNAGTTIVAFGVQFHRRSDEVSLLEIDYDFSVNAWTLKKYVAGSASNPSNGALTLSTNADHTIVITVVTSGGTTTVSATADGTPFLAPFALTDANYQGAGYVELLTYGGQTADITFKEFKVTNP